MKLRLRLNASLSIMVNCCRIPNFCGIRQGKVRRSMKKSAPMKKILSGLESLKLLDERDALVAGGIGLHRQGRGRQQRQHQQQAQAQGQYLFHRGALFQKGRWEPAHITNLLISACCASHSLSIMVNCCRIPNFCGIRQGKVRRSKLRLRLNANHLKLIAIIAMTIDHVSDLIYPGFPAEPGAMALHIVGRLTAPIMWFFVCEGYYYTRNVKRYMLRMGIFAVISHFAYCFAFGINPIPTHKKEGYRCI